MGRLRKFLRSAKLTAWDARKLGMSALNGPLANLSGRPEFSVEVAGYGRLRLRSGGMDLPLLRSVLLSDVYDPEFAPAALDRLEAAYRAILSAGRTPVVVNAGGYIGLSALWFARRWPKANVVSVEPDAGNLALLRQNVAEGPCHTLVEAALGSRPGRVRLNDDPEGAAIQTERAAEGIEVLTIDQVVALVPNGEPFICSLDIEGFEADLFSAETDWIDGFQLLIIEPHDWARPGERLSANFQREMARRPYEMYVAGSAIHYLRV